VHGLEQVEEQHEEHPLKLSVAEVGMMVGEEEVQHEERELELELERARLLRRGLYAT
jgi:hypothetical protein